MIGRWLPLGGAVASTLALLTPWWAVRINQRLVFEAGAFATEGSRTYQGVSTSHILDASALVIGIALGAATLAAWLSHLALRHASARPFARVCARVALVGCLASAAIAPLHWPDTWADGVHHALAAHAEDEPPPTVHANWWGRDGDVRFRPGPGWFGAVGATFLFLPLAAEWPRSPRVPSLPKVAR